MRRLVLLFTALSAVLLGGCSLYPSVSDWKSCRVDVASVHFLGSQENRTQWEIVLNVHNPNSSRLKLEGVQLFALNGADTLATLQNKEPLDLTPDTVTQVLLKAESTPQALTSVVSKFRQEGKCSFTVTGDATYHGLFGVHKYSGLFRKDYDVDVASILGAMGGNLLQGLQGLPFSF